jgi:hypothetical protein
MSRSASGSSVYDKLVQDRLVADVAVRIDERVVLRWRTRSLANVSFRPFGRSFVGRSKYSVDKTI